MFLCESKWLIFLSYMRWNSHRAWGSGLCCQTHRKVSMLMHSCYVWRAAHGRNSLPAPTPSFFFLASPPVRDVALYSLLIPWRLLLGLAPSESCCWHRLLLWAVPWRQCAWPQPPGRGEVQQGPPRDVTRENTTMTSFPISHTRWDGKEFTHTSQPVRPQAAKVHFLRKENVVLEDRHS